MPENPLVFRFAEFEVREQEFCIFKGKTTVPVEPRAFRVLLVLLRNPQKVITKDELLNTVWDDVEVTENSLTRSIVKLRHALEDDARSSMFIETVAKVGYRFICPVTSRDERSEEAAALNRPGTAGANHEPDTPGVGSAQVSASGQTEIRNAVWKGMTAGAILLLALVTGWIWHKHSREKWARESAEPEIVRLLDAGEYPRAAALALQASSALPGDLTIKNLWLRATGEVSIQTEPTGAEVDYRPYNGDPNAWTRLGRTPLLKIRLPQEPYIFRLTREGYAPEFYIRKPPGMGLVGDVNKFDIAVTLQASSSVPPEMVPVKDGWASLNYPLMGVPPVKVEDFLIDRHELTNEEFKRFVDAGGYQRKEYWKEPFVKDGRTLSWEQAMSQFHDATGRPGPATWEAGSYPNGRAQYPVAGVSWYEAMAYAAFAGKSLPTAYHWMLASQADSYTPLIVAGANFPLWRYQARWGSGIPTERIRHYTDMASLMSKNGA